MYGVAVRVEKQQIWMERCARDFCGRCPKCDRACFLFRRDNRLFCWGCGFRTAPDPVTPAWHEAFKTNYGVYQ